MSNDLMMFEGGSQLPAHLQGVNTGVTTALKAGMFTGGNRISLRNSRFRLYVNGIEEGVFEENYLDVIFLNAAPAVSRQFYKGAYKQGEKIPPTCYSADGIKPADDVKDKQNPICATCPQNVKGSKVDGKNKYKACGYFRRLVVMLAGDTEDRRIFKLDAKSSSLWGEGTAQAKALNDYIKMLDSRGVDVGQVVTRMVFDLEASVPKLLFKPARYITTEELDAVSSLVGSDEVIELAKVNMATVDLSEEVDGEEGEATETAQDATQDAPEQTATPVATPRPQTAQKPQQAAKPATQQAVKPSPGPTVETVPANVVQQPQQAKPQTARPQTAQTVKPTATPAPAVEEVDSADELDSILKDLDV